MRRFFLTGLALVGCLLGSTVVRASTRSNAPVDDAAHTYWLEAHNLIQEQVRLLDRVEQSTEKPELSRLKTLSGQVLLHTSAVNRFLKSNYPEPKLLCMPPAGLGEVAGTDGATLEQVQAYCSLYRSTRDLTTMKSRLDQQARLMTIETSRIKPVQQTARKKIVPVNVAAAVNVSSRDVLVLVQSSRQRLAQMQPAFPEALRISEASLRGVAVQPGQTVPTQSADMRGR
ncbi:MAG: hypothetical protein KME10_13485 [Plectolyngbya sp. WJT66-NPBG17]|jgi:hypothetical protein|nr:hypothetical protein [Plectolyngbya sp. WJT66-NPBG17]